MGLPRAIAAPRPLGARLVAGIPGLGAVVHFLGALTWLGWLMLLVGGFGTLIGLATRIPEVLIPSAGSLVLVVVAVLASLGSSPVGVSLELVADRVQVGEDATGQLSVGNRLARPARPGMIRFLVDGKGTDLWAPWLPGNARHVEPFIVTTNARGVIQVGPAQVVRGDVFGMVRRVQSQSETLELFVHPVTIKVPSAAVGFIKDLEGIPTTDLSSSDVSFRGLRDYAAGDDRRNIHWRTTARTGRLMIRQFEETRRAHLIVVLDVAKSSWADEAEFELGVSVAASVTRAAIAESVIVSLVSQHGSHNSATMRSALDELTTVSTREDAPPVSEAVTQATIASPQASVAVLVTGSTMPVGGIHQAMRGVPSSMLVTTLRCEPGAKARVSTVGAFRILVVPALEGLGVAMNRFLR